MLHCLGELDFQFPDAPLSLRQLCVFCGELGFVAGRQFMQLRDGCEFAVVRVNGKSFNIILAIVPALEGWRVAVSAAVVGFISSIVVQHSSVVVAAARHSSVVVAAARCHLIR